MLMRVYAKAIEAGSFGILSQGKWQCRLSQYGYRRDPDVRSCRWAPCLKLR